MICSTCGGYGRVPVEVSRAVPDHHPECSGPNCSDLCPIPVEAIEWEFYPCPDCSYPPEAA